MVGGGARRAIIGHRLPNSLFASAVRPCFARCHTNPGGKALIPELRTRFNAEFTQQSYQDLLALQERFCGAKVDFRIAETPIFVPLELLNEMAEAGAELAHRLFKEYEMADLPANHLIYTINFKPEPRPPLKFISNGASRDSTGLLRCGRDASSPLPHRRFRPRQES